MLRITSREGGYRDAYELWTYDGKHIGHFHKDEVYARNGKYLGEIMSRNRLITNKNKKSWRRNTFTPHAQRAGYAKYADYVDYAMYAGYEDFPKLEK